MARRAVRMVRLCHAVAALAACRARRDIRAPTPRPLAQAACRHACDCRYYPIRTPPAKCAFFFFFFFFYAIISPFFAADAAIIHFSPLLPRRLRSSGYAAATDATARCRRLLLSSFGSEMSVRSLFAARRH